MRCCTEKCGSFGSLQPQPESRVDTRVTWTNRFQFRSLELLYKQTYMHM